MNYLYNIFIFIRGRGTYDNNYIILRKKFVGKKITNYIHTKTLKIIKALLNY